MSQGLHARLVRYLICCMAVCAVGVTAYALWSAHVENQHLSGEIDQSLLLAARSLKHMLAPDFHDRAVDENSISQAEELANRGSPTFWRTSHTRSGPRWTGRC